MQKIKNMPAPSEFYFLFEGPRPSGKGRTGNLNVVSFDPYRSFVGYLLGYLWVTSRLAALIAHQPDRARSNLKEINAGVPRGNPRGAPWGPKGPIQAMCIRIPPWQ